MLQLTNKTPFSPAMSLLADPTGIDTLYVVVKGSFSLSGGLAVAEVQVPATLADEYWGEPGVSSLRYASELHVGKAGTDVILNGQAWAPEGGPVAESLVSVEVAERGKVVRVVGDRVWQSKTRFSRPEPFESVPLVYERAFGGKQPSEDPNWLVCEEHNPVGVGFLGERKAKELVGQMLPNLEDPKAPLQRIGQQRSPVGFGCTAPSWLPRRAFAGTYDELWQRRRAPYLPPDFDRRFFNAAAPELVFERFLEGGEPVAVVGASPRGPLHFKLPQSQPSVQIQLAGERHRPRVVLETVCIEPDEDRVCLSWRAQLPCDKQALKIETIVIEAPQSHVGGAAA